jgi:hypothetical protein
MAGTQVRCSSVAEPVFTGEKSRAADACSREGTCPCSAVYRMRCGGRHMNV